jgi:hypothetical protein
LIREIPDRFLQALRLFDDFHDSSVRQNRGLVKYIFALFKRPAPFGRFPSVSSGFMSKMRRWIKSGGALETTFCVGVCGWSVVWASAMPSLSFELLPQICATPSQILQSPTRTDLR